MFQIVSAKIIRIALVPALALWIAGAGCLIGCENGVQAAKIGANSLQLGQVVSAEACSSPRSHDCCAKKTSRHPVATAAPGESAGAITNTAGVSSETEAMQGCPLAVSRTVILAKARFNEGPAVVTNGWMLQSPQLPVDDNFKRITHLRPPNRGDTHLRWCVFLI